MQIHLARLEKKIKGLEDELRALKAEKVRLKRELSGSVADHRTAGDL